MKPVFKVTAMGDFALIVEIIITVIVVLVMLSIAGVIA
jgi:hypothetical protein